MELNEQNLIQVLSIANGSERSAEQPQAEAQLKEWEGVQGYHFFLQSVYLSMDLPLQLRWLAVICFKNGIDKHWRSSRPNAIGKDEKSQIKARLLTLVSEKNNQLMIQNAQSIGRIVRFDFPSEWPNLFDEIEVHLKDFVFQKGDMVSAHNLLLILNQIIKTLLTVRIGRAKHALQAKAPVIVPILLKLYTKFFQEWTTNSDASVMEICYLCLKNLRRIVPETIEDLNPQETNDFLRTSVTHLNLLISSPQKGTSELIQKYVKCYSKLYFNLINYNPTSFIILPCSSDIISNVLNYLQENSEKVYNSSQENDFWEIIALKSFLISKKLINYIYRKGAVTLTQKNDKQQIEYAVNKIKNEFFNPESVQRLCDLIITWYLILKPSDLASWASEPEEWCNEEFSSSWEYQIRPCAENFFQDMIKYFKDELSDYILNKISNGLGTDNVLIQDSTLCTFQLSADSICDKVDFNKILNEVLIPLGLNNQHPENRVIKRRVCLVINEWSRIGCSTESRVNIYKLLETFLADNQTDHVVKLTSVQCLKTLVSDWDFNKYDFRPFSSSMITHLMDSLKSLDFTESKLFVLNTLSTIIERNNPLIDYGVLSSLLGVMPTLWEQSNDENEIILKNSLLRVLKNLVVCLNDNSPETHDICLPLIRVCCTGNSEFYQLLSEDGYELWLSILQFYPVGGDPKDLVSLFPLVEYGLLNSTEILPLILSIIRSYALLAPELFVTDEALNLFRVLSGYIPNMRDDSFNVFIAFMDIVLLESRTGGSQELFLNSFVNSGLLNSLIAYVADENQPIVNANKVLVVLSRLAFKSSDVFIKILKHMLNNNLEPFFKNWLKYFNHNGNPRNKKISLLGLISILKISIADNQTIYVEVFPEIIKKTLLFLEEVNEGDSGTVDAYNSDYIYEDIDDHRYADPDILENGEKKRYIQLLVENDPIFRVKLRENLLQVINYIKGELSSEDFGKLMALNDEYSLETLQKLST